jgi:predicted transcriptional regulator
MATTTKTIRKKLHELADKLPADATWEDVRHQVELRASIERGLADSGAGRTVPHEEIIKEFGIAE